VEKRLIAGLAAALAAALLVIAFLIGRMTGAANVPAAVQAPVIVQRETPHDPPTPALQPPVAAPNEDQPALSVRETPPPSQQQTPPVREQPSAASDQRTPVPRQSGEAAAIASYFAKIDAIRVAGTGDPMVVAQGILGGIERGDTSGIDRLVDSAKLALSQAKGLQPPPSCAGYHQRLLGALSEAAGEMARMREAIVKSDLDGVTALAPQLQATQQKIEDLDRMKKQLLGQ
jgi:hypothetical protein